MKLKDFIEHVLVDIAEGMTAARDRVGDKIAINPHKVNGKSATEKDYVNFDIAVTVNKESEHHKSGSGKIGTTINVIAAGINGNMESSNINKLEGISKVNFRVPVFYGATFDKKD